MNYEYLFSTSGRDSKGIFSGRTIRTLRLEIGSGEILKAVEEEIKTEHKYEQFCITGFQLLREYAE